MDAGGRSVVRQTRTGAGAGAQQFTVAVGGIPSWQRILVVGVAVAVQSAAGAAGISRGVFSAGSRSRT